MCQCGLLDEFGRDLYLRRAAAPAEYERTRVFAVQNGVAAGAEAGRHVFLV